MFGIKRRPGVKLYKYEGGRCNASGKKIKELREAAGLSQEQLAAKIQLAGLNLNQKAISRIETGERVVPDFELLFFSEVLAVPIDKLLDRDE
ncbi:MAG: helix-turn-helix transcriptional regulator [Lachnospiraceae bacterium]|nr:helix-turn-helix transcriptional regulator [Lachnospiraceae bacterium]